jgi:hypothetical protein
VPIAKDTGGSYTSIELDASGNPVVSYIVSGALRILHCNDPNCFGTDDSVTSPDATLSSTGQFTSLLLDGAGNPVVSYHTFGSDDLKVLHCNDPNCSPGGESITSHDTAGISGKGSSLALDAHGNPVVSYYDQTGARLRVMTCNDPNCAGGDETFFSYMEPTDNVGLYTSLELDAKGRPVVAFHDLTDEDLKLLHCVTRTCLDTSDDDDDGCDDAAELQMAPGSETSGGRRNPKHFWDFYDVPTGGALTRDHSISALDLFAVLGRFGASGSASLDPLAMPPPSGYHTAFDRGPVIGPNVWNVGAADGSIAATDIFGVLGQFAHSCA